MSGETTHMNADVAFTVRRAGKVVDERMVVDGKEVDPQLVNLIKRLQTINKEA